MDLRPKELTTEEKEIILEQLFAAAKRIFMAQLPYNENNSEAMHFLALARTCALQSLRDKPYSFFSTDDTGRAVAAGFWESSAPIA